MIIFLCRKGFVTPSLSFKITFTFTTITISLLMNFILNGKEWITNPFPQRCWWWFATSYTLHTKNPLLN